jgi:hypothetical protein
MLLLLDKVQAKPPTSKVLLCSHDSDAVEAKVKSLGANGIGPNRRDAGGVRAFNATAGCFGRGSKLLLDFTALDVTATGVPKEMRLLSLPCNGSEPYSSARDVGRSIPPNSVSDAADVVAPFEKLQRPFHAHG